MKNIGEKIKNARKSKGLSTYELAAKLDLSHTSIANIEKGKSKSLTIQLAYNLSTILDLPFEDFLPSEYLTSINTINTNELRSKLLNFEIEIESLKKRVEEKDELIALLKIKNNSYKGWFVQLFVNDIQYTLSKIKDPIEKEKLYSLFDKNYNYYKKIGIISNNDIDLQISGMESVYKEFLDWYKKNI